MANAPSWLDQDQQQGVVGPSPPPGSSSPTPSIQERVENYLPACAKYVIPLSRVINMGLACLMAFSAVNGILKIAQFRLDTSFVALYMFIFASILFFFELCQFKYVAWIDNVFRRNFGFMYGSRGKALYIIFIAFLNFGLVSTGVLQFATGIVLAVDGCLMFFATFRYPSLFAGNTPAQPSASSSHPAAAASKGPGQV
ncbi:golgi apparatus membrane protein tvp15 [Nannochloropsis oceanica]